MKAIANFDEAFNRFVLGCQEMVTAYHRERFPSLSVPTLEVHPGKRYMKIVEATDWNRDARIYGGSDPSSDLMDRRSWGYVDTKNGDVLRGNWKGPTAPKVARGNIFAPDGGLDAVTSVGVKYLEQLKKGN